VSASSRVREEVEVDGSVMVEEEDDDGGDEGGGGVDAAANDDGGSGEEGDGGAPLADEGLVGDGVEEVDSPVSGSAVDVVDV
jgi:hypothetical protein